MRSPTSHLSTRASDKSRRHRRAQVRHGGAALLEMALALVVLLPLTFGMVEFSHFFYVKHSLQGAAREGARAAIVPSATNGSVAAAVSGALAMVGLEGSGYTTKIEAPLGTPCNVAAVAAGTTVHVTVECTWGAVGVRPMKMISAAKPVRGMTGMRKEE
jgi:Flp pilus assembly protein TadG